MIFIMNNRVRYSGVFSEIFGVEESSLNEDFNFDSVECWDSFAHLSLIAALEDTFDIMFETEDILHFGGYINGIKILEKYGVNFAE